MNNIWKEAVLHADNNKVIIYEGQIRPENAFKIIKPICEILGDTMEQKLYIAAKIITSHNRDIKQNG